MPLVKRLVKGSPLTWAEMDANLEYLEGLPALSGGKVVPWDLSPSSVDAAVTLGTVPPIFGGVNYGYIVGDSVLVDVSGTDTHLAYSNFGTITASSHMYFKPLPVVGSPLTYVSAVMFGDDIASPKGAVQYYPGMGLVTGGYAPIDAAFTPGMVAMIEVEFSTGHVHVTTPNGYFPSAVILTSGYSGQGIHGLTMVDGNGSAATGGITLTTVSDQGSGFVSAFPTVTMTSDATIPAGAVNGDTLHVTVAGSYDLEAYAVDDCAIVIDKVAGTVYSLIRRPVITPTYYETYNLYIGSGGDFSSLTAARNHVIQNYITGNECSLIFIGGVLPSDFTTVVTDFPGFVNLRLSAQVSKTNTTLVDVVDESKDLYMAYHNYDTISLVGNWDVGAVITRRMYFDGTISCSSFEATDLSTAPSVAKIIVRTPSTGISIDGLCSRAAGNKTVFVQSIEFVCQGFVNLTGYCNATIFTNRAIQCLPGFSGSLTITNTEAVDSLPYMVRVFHGATVEVQTLQCGSPGVNHAVYMDGGYCNFYPALIYGTTIVGNSNITPNTISGYGLLLNY